MNYVIFPLTILICFIGIFFVTRGLWELRTAQNRRRYFINMFPGLGLLFVVTLLLLFGNVV
ncbi:hypothetical protein ACFFGV_04845 [Pontibacillus salicampi]|uniref:DUF3995 domain-containing protein n=1 Tax=Pontibacillus salicampi TaxID=1449801 RepID=A0ABV6LKR3_9BACI